MADKLTIFDAFAGIGGIRLGFEKAHKNFSTIYAVDCEKKCKDTYDLNFEDTKLTVKDISELKIDNIPNHDIITAGFPCQPYSIAGKRQALDDMRGQIVYKLLKIIKMKKPKIVFLENVKNFKTINDGEPYKLVMGELKKYGYFVKDKILNTCEITHIPQNRERIFIIAFLDKNAHDLFEFPSNTQKKKNISDFLEEDIPDKYYYTDKSAIYPKLVNDVIEHDVIYQYRRHYVRENKSGNVPTLTANMGSGGHNCPIILDEYGIRKLTPKECFNFQGFPAEYNLPDIADAPLYKQAGNSVTVEVIKKIATNIYCAYSYGTITTQLQDKMRRIKCKKTLGGVECLIESYHYNDKKIATQLKNYHKKFVTLNKSATSIGGRNMNISEAFTEGLVCYMTNAFKIHKITTSKTKNKTNEKKISGSMDCYDFDDNKTVQIKASIMKEDCSSFGPHSQFDKLMYLDFSDCKAFKIYKIEKECIDDIIVSKEKKETFKDQQKQGRRPRFSIQKEIIKKNMLKPIFTGDINKLESYYKILATSIEDYEDLTKKGKNNDVDEKKTKDASESDDIQIKKKVVKKKTKDTSDSDDIPIKKRVVKKKTKDTSDTDNETDSDSDDETETKKQIVKVIGKDNPHDIRKVVKKVVPKKKD
jgi:DNA (cytosine-5)-methyltransferase 1